LKWALYNVLFALVYPFLLPGFLVRMLRRGGYAARIGDRFALYPRDIMARFLPDGKPVCGHRAPSDQRMPPRSGFVWIHAVSVGEVQVAGQLMREWRKVEPSVRFCFSTTSSTGWLMARKELASLSVADGSSGEDVLVYNPLDFPNFVKSALKTVRPRVIVLTESEIWPNFILMARRRGIPLFLVNARVSDRSAPRYRLARFFFGEVFAAFTRIFAQSELDRRRLVDAGAPAEKVDVTGSFKFDVARRDETKERELRAWIGPGEVLLGGSTWPGEDEVLMRIYRKILARASAARRLPPRLVLAPRHFEKADAVEENIRSYGFSCIRRSRGDASPADCAATPPVFLCDTTGEMMGLFGLCDAAFVGKSLCAHGSQNMIEPCLCGKPTAVGPHTENFRPVMSDLLEARAIVQVPDESGLEQTLAHWFDCGDDGLGARAAAAVANRRGVVPRCVAAMRSCLDAEDRS